MTDDPDSATPAKRYAMIVRQIPTGYVSLRAVFDDQAAATESCADWLRIVNKHRTEFAAKVVPI